MVRSAKRAPRNYKKARRWRNKRTKVVDQPEKYSESPSKNMLEGLFYILRLRGSNRPLAGFLNLENKMSQTA